MHLKGLKMGGREFSRLLITLCLFFFNRIMLNNIQIFSEKINVMTGGKQPLVLAPMRSTAVKEKVEKTTEYRIK